MTEGYFKYFEERTKDYVVGSTDLHPKRVKSLLTQVRKMAIKKYFQTPKRMEPFFSKEDWIQTAMITLFECCETYDGKQPFDNYARFMVSRRLTDKQRELYRRNPSESESKVDSEPNKPVDSRDDDPPAPMGHCHRPITEAIEEDRQYKDDSGACCPETSYIMEESRRTLLDCIDKLDAKSKALFVRHEMEEVSFQDLYHRFRIVQMAFSSFKRWYKDHVFDFVKKCVNDRMAIRGGRRIA
jgi:RNA polymerase sigma factor (sigma-70 family)